MKKPLSWDGFGSVIAHSCCMDTVKSVFADALDAQVPMPPEFSWIEDSIDEAQAGLEQTISRAFRAAHLLTGGEEQAEIAVARALDSWDPDDNDEQGLFELALTAALHGHVPSLQEPAGSRLPVELRAVLRLPWELRRCFVLRTLVGWPREMCARLLDLSIQQVDDYTSAALRQLPVLVEQIRAEDSLPGPDLITLRIRIHA
jgi:DNA-directed RNA polymerase specialized sigma24 family protein